MMKVVLATIPYENDFRSAAAAYLKTYAEKDSIIRSRSELSIVHLWRTGAAESDAHFHIQMLWRERPDVIGFSCYIWNIAAVLDLCACLKRLSPAVKIILGGPQVMRLGEAVLAGHPPVDIIVPGEGESAFADILRHLVGAGADSLAEIPGIIFRSGDRIIDTGPRPPIAILDSIPSPFATGNIDLDGMRASSQWVLYESARGCPFRCGYCNFAGQGDGVRNFSLGRVGQDLRLIFAKRVKSLWFIDSIFNINRTRTKRLLELIAAENISTEISLFFQFEWIDDEILERLLRIKQTAPRLTLATGVQSTNREALRLANRQWENIERKQQVVSRLDRAGLLGGNVYWTAEAIYGLPGDDYDKFKATVQRCVSLNPSQLELFPLHVLVGTSFYERREDLRFVLHPSTGRVLSCSSFSYDDMSRADAFATAALALYNSLSRPVLGLLAEALGCDLMQLFERFGEYLAVQTLPQAQPPPRLWRLLPDAQPGDFLKVRAVNGLQPADIFAHLLGFSKRACPAISGDSIEWKLFDLLRWEYHMSLVLGRAPVGRSRLPENPLAVLDTYPKLSNRTRVVAFQYNPLPLLDGSLTISGMPRQPATYVFIYQPGDRVNALRVAGRKLETIRACQGDQSVREILRFAGRAADDSAGPEPGQEARLFNLILSLARSGGLDLLPARAAARAFGQTAEQGVYYA